MVAPISGGFSNGPVGGSGDQFKDSLNTKSNEDLVKMLGKDSPLSKEDKETVVKELVDRMAADKANEAEKSGGGGDSGGGEEDDIKKLLKKLQDGTISPEELQKLAGKLGIDPSTLEKAAGKGGEMAQDEGDIK